jgi:hypothetical protein
MHVMAYDSPIHATLTQLSLRVHLHPPLSMQHCVTRTDTWPWKLSSRLFKRIERGHSFHDCPTSTSSLANGYSRTSSTPMALSSVAKPTGSFRVSSNVRGSTSTRHSPLSSSLALFTSCYIWRHPATGLSTNSTSRMHSCMASWLNGSIASSLPASSTTPIPTMFASSSNFCTGSSRHQEPGTSHSPASCATSGSRP